MDGGDKERVSSEDRKVERDEKMGGKRVEENGKEAQPQKSIMATPLPSECGSL